MPRRAVGLGVLMLSPLTPAVAWAQERIVGAHTIGAAASFEQISFSGTGLLQPGFAGSATTRITSVRQFTAPLSVALPIVGAWRMDATALYAEGEVRYLAASEAPAGGAAGTPRGIERTARLAGVSDVRLRASGPVLGRRLILTMGANIPTGQTSLAPLEFSVLRILSAPALGLSSTAVGSGPSGTAGLVYTRPAGAWNVAAGASYEYRGEYQPVAAITAGAPSADFQPGGVVRGSVSADRPIAAHRLSVALAVDVFATDRLRSTTIPAEAASGTQSATGTSAALVRLGPVLSGDAQLQLAASGLRELLLYTSVRYRAPFSRDGTRVSASSASYVESGVRATRVVSRRVLGVLSVDGRWHSGLGVDQGLPTNGVASAAASLGAQVQRGLLSFQPYVRGQAGSLRPTGGAANSGAQGFGGASAGLVIVQRF